jgi:anti-sigma factor (TIGR02949 family)
VNFSSTDPCDQCEEMLQPYLDRELTAVERAQAEQHLDACEYCRRRYRFEVDLRRFVRQAVVEPMAPELRQRLASLRTPL